MVSGRSRFAALSLAAMVSATALLPLMLPPAAWAYDTELARMYTAEKQWAYAAFEWRRILDKDPKNLEAQLGLADALSQNGNWVEAVRHLEVTRAKYPDARLDVALGNAYLKAELYRKASELYQSILETDRFNAGAYKGLKKVQDKLPKADQKEAKKLLLDRALEAKKLAVQALKDADYDKAENYYEIVTLYRSPASLVNDYAVASLLAGNSKRALFLLQRIAKQDDQRWETFGNLGLTLLSVGKTYAAKQQIEQAIALCDDKKNKARLYNNLGYVYEYAKQPTKAMFAYEHALQLDPKLYKAKQNLAYIVQDLGEYKRAIELYKSLVVARPKNAAEIYNNIGFVYELMDKPHSALDYYQRALRANPKLQNTYFNLGTLYKKLGKLDKASEYYKHLTELEFLQVEMAGKPVTKETDTEKAESPLFKFVDVFFSKEANLEV
ncbi:MAG: tetratricopeptide repeat protein [Candidatus Melainabacteria bacterium]